jgi:hypothetical protein
MKIIRPVGTGSLQNPFLPGTLYSRGDDDADQSWTAFRHPDAALETI